MEGKLRNVQYTEEKANELRFLACLHVETDQCIAIGFVIAQYLVLTSNVAAYRRDPITHVMISDQRRDVDKILCETREGIAENFVIESLSEPYLVVLTVSNFMNLKEFL